MCLYEFRRDRMLVVVLLQKLLQKGSRGDTVPTEGDVGNEPPRAQRGDNFRWLSVSFYDRDVLRLL